MEFEIELQGLQGDGISVWDAASLVQLSSVDFHKLRNVLEEFGQRSATAQGLSAPITDIWRLRSSDQRLYLQTAAAAPGNTILLGGLKVGRKKLFIHRANGAIIEVEPLCVLDVYVHESYQRQGVGKALFEYMLMAEQAAPEQLAYDRPSPKLLAFLKKHYTLCSFVPQNNHFVIFEQYFQSRGGNATMESRSMRSSTCNNSGSSPVGTCGGGLAPLLCSSLGNGRQNVQIIGTAASGGLEGPPDKRWLTTSVRPPTPSLQHSLQLHPADVESSCLSTTYDAPTATLTSMLGSSGCTAAGVPTHRLDKHHPSPLPQQCRQMEVQYARGAGYKLLDRGHAGGTPGMADGAHTFKGYEQALLGAATKPAPPLLNGMLPGVRDSLDQLTLSMTQQQYVSNSKSSSSSGSCAGPRSSGGAGREPPWACSTAADDTSALSKSMGQAGRSCQAGADTHPGVRKNYSLTTPYSSWEPRPGSLLPASPSDADRVSLRRQEAQQLQVRLQQQQARWQAMGAGPPGHLLAAPTSSYAVPTAGMADIIASSVQQQQPSSSILSWDGLPANSLKQPKQQHFARQGSSNNGHRAHSGAPHYDQRPGELGGSSYSSRQGSRGSSGGGMGQWGLEAWETAKTAAASHRAGTGAASCLRMV